MKVNIDVKEKRVVEVGDLIKHGSSLKLVIFDVYYEKIRLVDVEDMRTTHMYDNIEKLRFEEPEIVGKSYELQLNLCK